MIRDTDRERTSFLNIQAARRDEIRDQIRSELDLVAKANTKLTAKKAELSSVEEAYSQRLTELQLSLEHEGENRKSLERDLVNVRRALEDTLRQHPSKLEDLKRNVDAVKAEKAAFQKQLTHIRKELSKLKQAYEEGKPVAHLIDQAKVLLAHQAVMEEAMKRDQVEHDSKENKS
jgi:predicted nuclease with TOPRIM domain